MHIGQPYLDTDVRPTIDSDLCHQPSSLAGSTQSPNFRADNRICAPRCLFCHVGRANPAGPGFAAFGTTTILLSLINAGVLPMGGTAVVVPLALVFGGLTQMVVDIVEFQRGNTFEATASCSYGAFWMWYALLQLLAATRILDLAAAGPTMGAALLLWGVLTLYLWICTFRQPLVVFLIFLTLWIDYLLLGLGAFNDTPVLTHAGGWLGILCGAIALYGSFGTIINANSAKETVPLGPKLIP
ncbi:acetate uptake transporter [Novosphingobium terrae]|uniref:acetate uptake transporter n=1 Tax=Novosphingobium terrae TaxID=2726189 RepID=UPI001F12BE5E|nr:acetate uptake transporter [Novosphingobium terrae]